MGKFRALINSFSGGVLSPKLDGRVDLDVYRKGARQLTNFVPSPLGAVQNRSGSKYIARTKSDGQARFIPFIIGQDEEYVLEVGNGYMRFFEDGAQITDQLDYIAVGDSSYVTTSSVTATPDSWIKRSTPRTTNLNGVGWSSSLSLAVAVGDADSTDAYIITSPNGLDWTERSNGKAFALNDVTFGNSLFVAVGAADGVDAYILTSTDGTTWTERSNPKNFALNSVIWASDLNLFVAVGAADGADAYILTSPDGTTWTERSNGKNFALNGVDYSSDIGLLVAVGEADGTDAYMVTSPDGITWTERANPKNFALNDIVIGSTAPAVGVPVFYAVGDADGTDAYMVTSTNGTTWTEVSNPSNIDLNSITYSTDAFIFTAVGQADGTDAYIIAGNGIFLEKTNPDNTNLNGIISRGTSNAAEITSPYTTAQLYDIQYETKNNVMYLTHESHAPRLLTRVNTSDDEWSISVGGRFTLEEFIMYQEPLADFSVSPSAEITINAVDTGVNQIASITADAVIFKSGDLGKKIKAGAGEATILYIIRNDTGAPSGTSAVVLVEIDKTFDAASYASGSWSLVGGGNFQLTPSVTGIERGVVDLTNAAAVPLAVLLVNSGRAWTLSGSGTNEYWLANADSFFGEPNAAEVLEKGVPMYKNSAGIGTLKVGEWGWGNNDAIGYNTIYVRLNDEVDPDTYLAASGNPSRAHWLVYTPTAVTPIVTAAGSAVLNSEVGAFVEINGGLVEILANVSTRVYRGRVIKVLDSTTASDTWTLKGKAFSATNGYPGAVVIHEDRLCFAGTTAYPLRWWASAVGEENYSNFTPGTADGDSLSFELNTKEASKILWLISRDILVAGTEGGEWQLSRREQLVTPSTPYARRQTSYGSDIRYPIVAHSNILFVERGNRKLRELTYAFENDSYLAPDRLLLASNLSVDLIKQLAYQPRNDSIVWAMLESGEVIGMAYEPAFDVYAWFKINTGMTLAGAYDGSDDIESIAVISDSSGVKELWAVVERIVNGGTIRCVEVFKNLFDSDTATDAIMLDCCVISTTQSTTQSGLSHLEGDTVTYIIDGDSTKIGTATVSSGAITISSTPTTNVVIGIPYTSTLQTMRLEGGGQRGSAQGKKKRAWEFIVRLYRTMKGKIGTTSTIANLESIPNVATLTSADRIVKNNQGTDTDGIVTIVQDQPLPMTITMLQPDTQENEI